jgi:hypothetical protein
MLLITFVFLFNNTLTCQNLIRNGSFENYHTPINWNSWGGDFIGYYTWPPDTVMIDWKQYSSPDFFITACTHTYSGVPKNVVGYGYSKEGYNHVGFIAYVRGSNIKEYIYQQLSQPLQAGKIYCLSFFVSKADGIPYAIKSIGASFSNSTHSLVNGYQINTTPQVVNTGSFISDTTQWIEIQGCFTANGNEQYITIGNFTTNANTDTLNVGTNNPVTNGETESYYYLDDITLIDQSTVGVNELGNENSFEVYPNPANDVLNIKVGTIKENTKIKIADVIGRTILITESKSQLDISFLEKGIYFVTIQQEGKTLGTKKIIKQ